MGPTDAEGIARAPEAHMHHQERTVGGRTVELSNLDKVLFPGVGLTKGDLVDYYDEVGAVMLPHLTGRFISMHRWPDGLDGHDFYQKQDVAEVLAAHHPDRLTTGQRKATRRGRIFVDFLRNEYAQTTVAPYAVRARPGAPVAVPLDWDELSRAGMGPRKYNTRNIFRRLGQRDDPWTDLDDHARSLGVARAALDDIRRKA